MSTLKKFGYGLVVATLVALAPGGSQATLTLQSGFVGGSGDVDNVVFNPCGPNFATQIGIQIQGCLNSSTTTLERFPIILRHSLQRRSSWYTLRV
jgi:hypothetical protein